MDITPIVVTLILAATAIFIYLRHVRPDLDAKFQALARSAVLLAQDKKLCGIIPDGQTALDFASEWLLEAANEQGYKINIKQAEEAARIAYRLYKDLGK